MICTRLAILIAAGFMLMDTPGRALEIANVRSGPACPKPGDTTRQVGRICFQAEDIHITGQGACFYDKDEVPCTWYGFEFDYSGAMEGDKITCAYTTSEPADVGDPDGVTNAASTSGEYELSLKPGASHFFNPQYSVLRYVREQIPDIRDETVCSFDGEELFRFKFNLISPKADN